MEMADLASPVQRGPPWMQLMMLMAFNTALYVANAFLEKLFHVDILPIVGLMRGRVCASQRHTRPFFDRGQSARRSVYVIAPNATVRIPGASPHLQTGGIGRWWWGFQRRLLGLHAQFCEVIAQPLFF